MAAGPALPDGDEARLIEAARRGDGHALEQLLTAHYDRVHALCRRMVGDVDADDATQDALLAAVRGITRFDGRSALGTWLYRIATNTCLDELRRRRRRPMVGYSDDIGQGDRDGTVEGAGGGGGGGPMQTARYGRDPAESVSDRMDVDAALATLPEEFRVAVVLRDLCDLSYEEIAQATGVPAGTVRSRIARGRGALADLIGNAAGPAVVQSPGTAPPATSSASGTMTAKGEEHRP